MEHFKKIRLIDESTTSKSGRYWETWSVDTVTYKSFPIFKSTFQGGALNEHESFGARFEFNNGQLLEEETFTKDYLRLRDGKTASQKQKADEEADEERKQSKKRKGCCGSLCGSLCDCIIDSIPGLRCIIDCCC